MVSLFIVIVPVLSAHKVSIVATSSEAVSLVTSTPCFASSIDPRAMLKVNMAGSATGMAVTSSMRVNGSISSKLPPFITCARMVNPRSKITVTSNQVTTFEITSSMCSLGLAI